MYGSIGLEDQVQVCEPERNEKWISFLSARKRQTEFRWERAKGSLSGGIPPPISPVGTKQVSWNVNSASPESANIILWITRWVLISSNSFQCSLAVSGSIEATQPSTEAHFWGRPDHARGAHNSGPSAGTEPRPTEPPACVWRTFPIAHRSALLFMLSGFRWMRFTWF